MVETGGLVGIALAGLFVFGLCIALLYATHKWNMRHYVTPRPNTRNVPVYVPREISEADGLNRQEEEEKMEEAEEDVEAAMASTTKTLATGAQEDAASISRNSPTVVSDASEATTGTDETYEQEEEEEVENAVESSSTSKLDVAGSTILLIAPTTSTMATEESVEVPALDVTTTVTIEEQETEQDPRVKKLEQQLNGIVLPSDEEIQDIFEEVDRNSDGKLTMPEVEKAIIQRKAQFNLKPTVVMRAFQKADTDQDGVISQEEFFTFVRFITYFKNLSNVFDAMDTDKNRRLYKDEFIHAAGILDINDPETVFTEMDENQGGYIVFDDFCIWMTEKRHDEKAFD